MRTIFIFPLLPVELGPVLVLPVSPVSCFIQLLFPEMVRFLLLDKSPGIFIYRMIPVEVGLGPVLMAMVIMRGGILLYPVMVILSWLPAIAYSVVAKKLVMQFPIIS